MIALQNVHVTASNNVLNQEKVVVKNAAALIEPPIVDQTVNSAIILSDANNNIIQPVSSALEILKDGDIGSHVTEWSEIKHESKCLVTRRTLGCQTSQSLEKLNLNAN